MSIRPILKLASGGYLAVTMRAARFHLFTSMDGRTFAPALQPAIEPEEVYPGANGLFDPTRVELPDGRIVEYSTAASGPMSATSRAVKRQIIRGLFDSP
jgi:hypothetical protein